MVCPKWNTSLAVEKWLLDKLSGAVARMHVGGPVAIKTRRYLSGPREPAVRRCDRQWNNGTHDPPHNKRSSPTRQTAAGNRRPAHKSEADIFRRADSTTDSKSHAPAERSHPRACLPRR